MSGTSRDGRSMRFRITESLKGSLAGTSPRRAGLARGKISRTTSGSWVSRPCGLRTATGGTISSRASDTHLSRPPNEPPLSGHCHRRLQRVRAQPGLRHQPLNVGGTNAEIHLHHGARHKLAVRGKYGRHIARVVECLAPSRTARDRRPSASLGPCGNTSMACSGHCYTSVRMGDTDYQVMSNEWRLVTLW